MIDQIHWLGHASFRIDGPPQIYIDPWRIPNDAPSADVILVTHEHYDHCSPHDIDRLLKPHTQIIASEGAARMLGEDYPITVLRPYQSINVGRANIKAVPAYTFDENHPADRNDVGFVIALNHYDIFYVGDTDFIPEFNKIRCDIAIVPVSAKEGIMTINDAVEVIQVLKPQYVIPSHYNSTEGGTRLDASALENAINNFTTMVWLDDDHTDAQANNANSGV